MITYIATPDYYRDYISHHGILGMHWGKRNGPPYPLGTDDHSASEKKAGWKKSLGSGKIKKKKIENPYIKQIKHPKARKVYTLAILKKDVETGRRDLTADEWRILSTYEEEKANKENPGFIEWLNDRDPNREFIDTTKTKELNKAIDDFHKETANKEQETRNKNSEIIKKNRSKIASSMAKDMINDFKRWDKAGDAKLSNLLKINGKSVSESTMKNYLEKQILNNIESNDPFVFGDGTFNFTVNGINGYSDAQPLTVDFDPKTNKIKNWYYL